MSQFVCTHEIPNIAPGSHIPSSALEFEDLLFGLELASNGRIVGPRRIAFQSR